MKTQKKYDAPLCKAELMKQIVEVRYTDLEEEKRLCKELLSIAEPEQDTYACAFANVYLLDSFLALGDYANCDFYLTRASFLCKEHGYDELFLTLCNCAGLYYQKLNDEQTALQYYLDGLRLAKPLGYYETESKLLNNIGIGFGDREDWATAAEYFAKAFAAIKPHLADGNSSWAISYLNNYAEACRKMGNIQLSAEALAQCEEIGNLGLYQRLRLACGRCSHYAYLKEKEHFDDMLAETLRLGLLRFENKFFVCDMCLGLLDNTLDFADQARAQMLLGTLEKEAPGASLALRYRIQCKKIRYLELFGKPEELNAAYEKYYKIDKEMMVTDDQARAKSMLSRIQLAGLQQKREAMFRENRELESATQLDELTGLYNRRYFNKLVSKTAQSNTFLTLGFVMLDVDYFKQYNDYYGHFQGDDALRIVGAVLKQEAQEGIFVSRYGGDEFVCLCVDLQDDAVEAFASRMRRGLVNRRIPHEKSPCSKWLTLSIGYCNERTGPNTDIGQLLQMADQALYLVKQAGRNGYARKRLTDVGIAEALGKP